MKRREAIKTAALSTSSVLLSKQFKLMDNLVSSKMKNKPVDFGVQLFTVPHMCHNNLKDTFHTISDIGYKEIEFFGPYPASSDLAKNRFKEVMGAMVGLKDHSFFGYTLSDTVQMLQDYKLTVPSIHVDISTLRSKLPQIAETGQQLGTRYLIIAAVFENRNNLDGYKRLAEEFDGFGEQLSKDGMKFAYHNHGYEHIEMDRQIPMDYLIQNTNPDFVQFELDIFWMKAAGAEPISYLQKYPGRFKLLHLKDSMEEFRFSGDGSTPDQWMEGFSKMSDPGDGIYGIASIIEKAADSGAEHFYLERDMAPDAISTLENSFQNLSKMI